MHIKDILEKRGFLYQYTNTDFFDKLDAGEITFYCGFDPSADSLHLGNFIGFMVALHLMSKGNKYYALVGGATGMIGDPGGKNSERNFLDTATLDHNQKSIHKQIKNIISRIEEKTKTKLSFELVNNKDFFEGVSYLDFLRNIGKYYTVNQMISKDTVKKRLTDPDQSISYTEFSYMLMQGSDYVHLFTNNNVTLQIGGQDQWGNLLTGVELIRKKLGAETHALTWPLITDSTGRKFGKSEGNALFLDENKTKSFDIYQYFVNSEDEMVEVYLKLLTFLSLEEIDEIIENHKKNPEKRQAQKILAYEVISTIHGEEKAQICKQMAEFLFGENDKIELLASLDKKIVEKFFTEIGVVKFSGENLFEIFVKSGLEKTNSTARQSFGAKGLYINEKVVEDMKIDLEECFGNKKFLLLRRGKKNYSIVVK